MSDFEKRLKQAFNFGRLDKHDFLYLFEAVIEHFKLSPHYIYITTELRIKAFVFEIEHFMDYSEIEFLEDFVKK